MDFFKSKSDKEETKPFLEDKDKGKDKVKANNGFGGKTIGFVGGFSLLVSNLTGPGLVSLSLVYQDAGWLYPTISLVIMMVMSTLSGVFLCEAMATIPGNESLQGRVEFATLARFYFGKVGHLISQIFINASLQSTNIAGIIISSQVMDSMFVGLFKRSCGVEIYPRAFHWVCVNSKSDDESPFGDVIMLFTIGYLVVMAIIIPLGYLNLDDNIIIQIAALIFLITVILDWIVTFSMTGLTNEVSAFTTAKQQAGVLGTVMFNFSFITTIPSWVNEKKPSVSVHKSLWSACIISTITFFLVGYLGSRAFGDMSASSDILSVINASRFSDIFSRILVYLFPLMVLATSIPVYSIIVRYNLLQNKVCSKFWANICAVVIPWAVAIPFMKGGALNGLVNYSSLAFAASANFILPFIIYVRARNFRANLLNGLESMKLEQLEIIRSMHPEIDEEEVEKEKEKEKIMHYVVDAEEDEPDGAEERPIKDTKQQKQKQEEEQRHMHQQHLQENVPIPLPPTFRALGRFDERVGMSKSVAWASMGVMGVAIVVVIVCYSI